MKLFVSYARENSDTAHELVSALNSAGFLTFLDTRDLPPGGEFHARIKSEIDAADVFIFLASEFSVAPGSYSLTELSFAETKWPDPTGNILPVILPGFSPDQLPAYLRPVGALRPVGNLIPETVAWVKDREDQGFPPEPSPGERLRSWSRRAKPPLRSARFRIPMSALKWIIIGALMMLGGYLWSRWFPVTLAEVDLGFLTMVWGFVPFAIGFDRALRGVSEKPVAVVVLDTDGRYVDIEDVSGQRFHLECAAWSREAYTGDLGWAYISGKILVEFVPASQPKEDNQSLDRSSRSGGDQVVS